MPSYSVSYLTPHGKRVERIYDAVDAEALRTQFSGRLVTALSIRPHEGRRYDPRKLKVSTEMLIANLDVIEVLLEARIPLQLVLRKLVEGLPPGPIRFLWSSIAAHIENHTGDLTPAFGQFPHVFPVAVVGMVQSNAAAGDLAEGIREARGYIETMHELRKLAVGAMIYPACVLFFALGVFFMMMFFTVPAFAKMLNDFMAGASTGKKLPFITRVFFDTSAILNSQPLLCLAAVVGFGVTVWLVISIPALKRLWFRFLMKLPIIERCLWALAVARFANNFASCYKATGQAMQALDSSRLVLGNPVIIELLDKVREEIQNGKQFGEAMRHVGGFPVPLVVAIENGESNLAGVLKRMGNFYSNEAKRTVSGLMKLLEPAMTVGVILFAAVAVLALFLPLIEIMRAMK